MPVPVQAPRIKPLGYVWGLPTLWAVSLVWSWRLTAEPPARFFSFPS